MSTTHRLTVGQLMARAGRVSLIVYHRDGVEVVPLPEGEALVVGRDDEADLVVVDESLSRSHARFSRDADTVLVEDLGSTNGTRVNGEVVERAEVVPGDEVLLGTVAISVHALAGTAPQVRGVEGHERFQERLEEEIARARTFGRPFGLAMIHAAGAQPLLGWWPHVRGQLRPIDRVALYGPTAIELLLLEAPIDEAERLARRLVESSPTPLRVGVAAYPDSGTGAEALLAAARDALADTTAKRPVGRAQPSHRAVPPSHAAPIAENPKMRAALDLVDRVAGSAIAVLVLGETGAGKEVIAQAIHERSGREAGPIRCVNCAAIPGELLESVLFGHEKGAFTGAIQQSPGVFEQAEGGTVFLDEVGELSARAQAALLRVLEAKTVTRVGATVEIPVDVRIVAATHRDLERMVDEGTFRRDLLFRLNTMVLEVPPLRDRPEDVEPLAARFLAQANEANGRDVRGVEPDALDVLRAYRWPGNVRELRNVMERAVVIAQSDRIGVDDLPRRVLEGARGPVNRQPSTSSADELDDFKSQMRDAEVRVILAALTRTGWNKTRAAELLSMPLRTFVHKCKVLGIQRPT
ncbi:MAG: sigma 54-interacting transcriptional regulator [Sandaracinaceae bacterium]|nr:sigma 54-interacting transcriptional regulator [Sandaracinaceae bacterium]